MKIFNIVFYCICSSIPALAQLPPPAIPQCGLGCVAQTVPQVCSLTDTVCQCTSTKLAELTVACMLANCTMQDSLEFSKFQANFCKLPTPNRTTLVRSVIVSAVAVSWTMVVLRVFTKTMKGGRVETEDWIIMVSAAGGIPSFYFTMEMVNYGFGKHLWSLEEGDLSRILRNFYIGENLYVAVLATTKLSILAFYLRIFQHERASRLAVYIVGFITIVSTVTISLLTIFTCHPIPFFWDFDLKGKCVNVNALAYANSAMSIIQDVAIITLPIPVVWRLQMNRKKKIGVGFMFALGGLGCIISIIRLRALLSFGDSRDPSWDYVDAVIWTALELSVAMICSCLPAIRYLLISLYPRHFISSIWSSKEGWSRSRDSRKKRSISGEEGANDEVEILGDEESDGRDGRGGVELSNIVRNEDRFEYPRQLPEVFVKDRTRGFVN